MGGHDSELVCSCCQRKYVAGPSLPVKGELLTCIACGGIVFVTHSAPQQPVVVNVKRSRPAPRPPKPFEIRLAHYLHCEETELRETRVPPRSTMKFWIAFPLGSRYDGKPIWLIRSLLRRLHRLVHGL